VTVRFAAPRHKAGLNIFADELWKGNQPYILGNAALPFAPAVVRTTAIAYDADNSYQATHHIARKQAVSVRRHATNANQVIVSYGGTQGYTIATGEQAMLLRTDHGTAALAYGGGSIPVRSAFPVVGGNAAEVVLEVGGSLTDAGALAVANHDLLHINFMRQGTWQTGLPRWQQAAQVDRVIDWVEDGGHVIVGGQHTHQGRDWLAYEARWGQAVARAMFEAEYRYLAQRIGHLDPSRIAIAVENEPSASSFAAYNTWLGDYAVPFLRGLFPDHTLILGHPGHNSLLDFNASTGALAGDRNCLTDIHFYELWEAASERTQFRLAAQRSHAGGRGGLIFGEIGVVATHPQRAERMARMFRLARSVGAWFVPWVAKAGPDWDVHSLGYRTPAGNWIIREDMQPVIGPIARRPHLAAGGRPLRVGGKLVVRDTQPTRLPWTPPAPPSGDPSPVAVTWNPPVFAGLVAHLDASWAEAVQTNPATADPPVYGEIKGPYFTTGSFAEGQGGDLIAAYIERAKIRQGAAAGAWVNRTENPAWSDHIGGPYHGIFIAPGESNRNDRDVAGLFMPTISAGGTHSFTIVVAYTGGRGAMLGVSGAAWNALLEITENTLRLFSDSALDVNLPVPGWAESFDDPIGGARTHVITVRSRAGIVDVYLDGTLIGVRDCTGKAARVAALVVGNDKNVGAYSSGRGAIGWYHDVFQYDVALSDADMATLHAACLARYTKRGLRKQAIIALSGQSNAEYLTDHAGGANGGTNASRIARAAIRQALGSVNVRLRWSKVAGGNLTGTGTMRGGCALDVWVDTSSGIGNEANWDWTTIDVGANSRNFYTGVGAAGDGPKLVVVLYHNEYDAARGPSAKAMYKATLRAFIRLVRRDAQFQVPILLCGPMPYVSSVPAGGLRMTAEVFDEVAAELPGVHRVLRNLGDLGFSQDSGDTTFGNPHQHWRDSVKVYHRLGREIGKAIGFDNAPATTRPRPAPARPSPAPPPPSPAARWT